MFPLLALALDFCFAFGLDLGLLAAPGLWTWFWVRHCDSLGRAISKGGGVGRRKEWAAGVHHLFLKSLQHPFFKGFCVGVVVANSAIAKSLSQAHERQLPLGGRHVHYALHVVSMENLFTKSFWRAVVTKWLCFIVSAVPLLSFIASVVYPAQYHHAAAFRHISV